MCLCGRNNLKGKATFSHEDLPYLKDSVIHLWSLGIKAVLANLVFEDVWDKNDPVIFEQQLRELADYVIEKEIWKDPDYTVRFFDPATGLPVSPNRSKNTFCGSGKMVAVDCDGNLFPCIRFTEFSLENQKSFSIGNVNTGIIKDRLKPFKYLSIGKISDEECKNCEVASGCMTCAGLCYDTSSSGTVFKKAKYLCEMHKANVRAIEYFWSEVGKKLNGVPNPREEERRLHQKSFNRYLAIYLADNATPHCRYSNKSTTGTSNKMSKRIIEEALNFAKKNSFTPIFIGLPPKEYRQYASIVSPDEVHPEFKSILIHDGAVRQSKGAAISILHVYKSTLKNLSENVKLLFEQNRAHRVNIILKDIETFDAAALKIYKSQLEDIAKYILEALSSLQVNVLNGLSKEIDSVNGSGCGVRTFAVMPNGRLYACPGFYFEDENKSIGDLDNGLTFNYGDEFEIGFSKDCVSCSNCHCDHCIYLNKRTTNEYSISPDILCQVSDIERQIGIKLVSSLKEKQALEQEEVNNL